MQTRTLPAFDGLRGGGRGWTLLAVAVGWLFIVGGRYLIPAVLPQVKAAFGLGNVGGGIAVTVIWAAYGLSQTPAGVLSDRLGERRVLAGSLLLTAVSVLALGLAPLFVAFLAGCGAFGLATGLFGPPRGTVLSRTFPETANSAIGVTLAAGSVGSAALPFLAGAVVGQVSWRVVVGGLAVPLALAAWLTWWGVPALGGTRDGDESLRSRARAVLQAMAVRRVALASVAATLFVFGFQAISAFYVTYLLEARDIDQRVAAGMLAVLFVGGAVGQLLGGAVADRIGARAVLAGAAAVSAVSVGVLPFVHGLVPLVVLSLLIGSRLALTTVSNAYIIAALPAAVTGSAWGTLRTGFFVLGATGSTFVGFMADSGLFDAAWLVLAGISLLSALLYLGLPATPEPTG